MKLLTDNIKIIVIAAVILMIVLYTAKSPAQSKEPPIKTIDVVCATEKQIEDTIVKKFKEQPMLVMNTSREINGKETNLVTILFVNPQTKTWTLAEQWTETEICVISVGKGIVPFVNPGKPV
jgi:hypothetical protein